jgi:hypothetical protein
MNGRDILDTKSTDRPNDSSGPFIQQGFPPGGLVAMSRIASTRHRHRLRPSG